VWFFSGYILGRERSLPVPFTWLCFEITTTQDPSWQYKYHFNIIVQVCSVFIIGDQLSWSLPT
jgi:hypothetical protein